MKTKIICLIGGCGVGKNYVLNEVCKNFNVHTMVSHTTRPKREGEIEGKDYHYIDKDKFIDMFINNEFIETRKYDVVGDVWSYGVAVSEIATGENNILIVDANGYLKIKEYCCDNDIECISIYLKASVKARIERYMKRNTHNQTNDEFYYEMCRRILDDLKKVEVFENEANYIFENEDMLDLTKNMIKLGEILNG